MIAFYKYNTLLGLLCQAFETTKDIQGLLYHKIQHLTTILDVLGSGFGNRL